MERSTAIAGWVIIAAIVLSGCTNTKPALDVSGQTSGSSAPAAEAGYGSSGINPLTAEQDRDIAAGGSSAATSGAGQIAAIPGDVRIQLSPVIGAPENALTPLSSRLAARAGERGIPISSSAGSLSMKGYFSAISEEGETTVIYVWDIIGADGKRLHRIQGKQKELSRRGEGWNAVTAPTMEAIADQTVNDLATWLSSRQV